MRQIDKIFNPSNINFVNFTTENAINGELAARKNLQL
ncbi:hypothetical protein B6N60_02963 [Richelia sinica FACHB-800]|uniref:Uncharacterized protein n=1 Tax=Richelia sinica FACHB-800 TaxID=1357546 RepID=A0A975T8W4_9NOST|nr:hypothetical protein B6N60_02963 [Richelia sinica FACHB-800]